MNNKAYGMIGLATRARKIVSGEFSTEKAVKTRSAFLVLVAEDASDNTKKLFQDKCAYYEVPVRIFGTKAELGAAMGKELRASVAITDLNFATQIMKHIDVLSLDAQEADR